MDVVSSTAHIADEKGSGPRWSVVLGLAAPVSALYAGQFLIGALPGSQGWGLSVLALGLVLLLLRVRNLGLRPWEHVAGVSSRPALLAPQLASLDSRYEALANGLQMAAGLFVILPLALDVDRWKSSTPAGQTIALWITGCLLVALAAGRLKPQPIALGLHLPRLDRWDTLVIAALLAGSLLLRVVQNETIPFGVDPDEASLALSAVDAATGAAKDPFATGWATHPTLQFFIHGQLIRLFGRTMFAMRLQSALLGVLAVAAIYLLARAGWGRRVAVLAGLLALSSDVLIQFSRLGVNNIGDALFIAWTLAALWAAGGTGSPWLYALAGVGLGLGQYYYFGARAIPFVVLVTLLVWLLADPRGLWRARYLLLAFGLVTLAVAGPLLGHWLRDPGSVSEHLFLTLPFSSHVQEQAAAQHLSVAGFWWQQIRDSLLVFIAVSDRGSFYHPGQPLLQPLQAPVFLLGLVATIASWRRPANRGLLLWLLVDLALGSVLMNDPAAFHRILGVVPAAILLVAIGLDAAAETVAPVLRWSPRTTAAFALAVAVILAGIDLNFYFRVYPQTVDFKPPNQEAVTVAALDYERLAGQGAFVLDTGDGVDAEGKIYHSPIAFVAGPSFQGAAPKVLDRLAASAPRPLYFYVLPDRAADLAQLAARFPGGQFTEYRRRTDNLLVLTRYAVQ